MESMKEKFDKKFPEAKKLREVELKRTSRELFNKSSIGKTTTIIYFFVALISIFVYWRFFGVNILVLNLLRPNSITCRRHLCTDDVIPYLNKINPPLDGLVITHFGSYMDSPRSQKNFVPSQVKKLREKTDIKNVIAAEDGLKIKIDEILK